MPQPALDTHAEVRKLKQAGCPEEQAIAMVNLVNRAPLNAQIVESLQQVQFHLKAIEDRMVTVEGRMDAIDTRMDAIDTRMDGIEMRMDGIEMRIDGIEANMATKSDLQVMRAETNAGLEALRAEMSRMFWIQGGALATLILGLATIMLGIAI